MFIRTKEEFIDYGEYKYPAGRLNTMRFGAQPFFLLSNAVVVAPGGVGTLLEFMYTWQLIQVKHTCNIPVILLGEMWRDFLRWIEKHPL